MVNKDPVPHGLKGYRTPYFCTCPICKAAWAAYCKVKRDERKARVRNGTDDLAQRRAQKRTTTKKKSESRDSVGEMEAAVLAEVATLPPDQVRATQLVAAKSLAALIDGLNASDDKVGAAVINSSTKQLMTIMAEMRGDTGKAATGKRKSGGRLATVGAMTKVKRQGA